MSQCPLCGQKGMDDGRCQVCGYADGKSLHGDMRDERKADPLKVQASTPEALERRLKLTLNNLSTIDPSSSRTDEVVSTVAAAVEQLSIPLHVPFDKSIRLTDVERRLVLAVGSVLDEVDEGQRTTVADVETYLRLANAEYAMGDSAKALAHLDRAILKEPRYVEALYGKARILFNERRYDAALKTLGKAAQISPGNEELTAFKALVEQMASSGK